MGYVDATLEVERDTRKPLIETGVLTEEHEVLP